VVGTQAHSQPLAELVQAPNTRRLADWRAVQRETAATIHSAERHNVVNLSELQNEWMAGLEELGKEDVEQADEDKVLETRRGRRFH
jgi:hypothetical protein